MKQTLAFAGASVLSGALFCLALPPGNQWWFGWIAFVPLLVVVKGKGFLFGFGGGLLALFATAFCARSGVFYSEKAFVGTDSWIVTGCGLFGFVVSILLGFWADKGVRRPIWWYAALAVLLEACLLIQLPAHIALTQYQRPLAMTFASLGGIWLVSFVVWLANFLLAELIIAKKWQQLSICSVVLAAVLLIPIPARSGEGTVSFAVVQTEATDSETLTKLHRQASDEVENPIVVWPEFAGLGFAPGGDVSGLVEIAKIAPIVTSFNDDFRPLPHNAAALITSSGSSPFYFKRKLFGGEVKMHAAGNSALAVDSGQGKIALGVCFDSCYPSIVREAANLPGVIALALPTIDPESPHNFVAAIHAAFTPFRAAENGIVIARADGFAHSMIVDGTGKIVLHLGDGELTGGARAKTGLPTLYKALGDWWLYLSGVAVVAGLLAYRKPKSKTAPTEEERFSEFVKEN